MGIPSCPPHPSPSITWFHVWKQHLSEAKPSYFQATVITGQDVGSEREEKSSKRALWIVWLVNKMQIINYFTLISPDMTTTYLLFCQTTSPWKSKEKLPHSTILCFLRLLKLSKEKTGWYSLELRFSHFRHIYGENMVRAGHQWALTSQSQGVGSPSGRAEILPCSLFLPTEASFCSRFLLVLDSEKRLFPALNGLRSRRWILSQTGHSNRNHTCFTTV